MSRIPMAVAGLLLAGALAVSDSMLGSAQAAEAVTVGVGGSSGDAPLYIAIEKGYFRDEGLDVKVIVMDSGAKVIAPLGTGQLDVGGGALSVGFYNALARGVAFRIVADRGHSQPGYFYQSLFLRRDLVDSGEFRSLKDLKGKRIGFAAPGVTSLSLLNEATKAGGIAFDDVTPVYLSFPQQGAALQNKVLDGSFLIEPQATLFAGAGIGARFINTEEFYPGQQISVLFYSDRFVKDRHAVAERFMRAWLRAVRVYTDSIKDGKIAGVGADEIVRTLSRHLDMPPELIRAMYSHAVDPAGAVNVAGLQKDLAFFTGKGWVTGTINLDDVVDMSFARKADAELGPYRPGAQ